MRYLFALVLVMGVIMWVPDAKSEDGLMPEYTFEAFCKSQGNIALMAKHNAPLLQDILPVITGPKVSMLQNMWISAVVAYGAASTADDNMLYMEVYNYCSTSNAALQVYKDSIPHDWRKDPTA